MPPRNYKVGKGRPPLATRFKPGQSGNPKGRPKGVKSLTSFLNEALDQTFSIQENGRPRKISAREGIARTVVNLALKGNIKAMSFILSTDWEVATPAKPTESITSETSPHEAIKIYKRMMDACH